MALLIKRFFKQLYIISVFSPFALFWMFKAFLIDWAASRRAYVKLPQIGSKIGLTHLKSDYIKEFGELKGNINGYKISVLPFNSMNPVIIISYKNTFTGLEVSLQKPTVQLSKNAIAFKTSNWKFNRIFKTVRASRKISEKFKNNQEFLTHFVKFYSKYIFQIDNLIFRDTDIYCSFRYGFNLFPYIPVSKIQSLIKDLYSLAEKIDTSLK